LASGADFAGADLEPDLDFSFGADFFAGAFLIFDFALAMPPFYRLPVAMGRREWGGKG
jgi:hypothetical protein